MHRRNYIEKALKVRKQAFLPPARTINFPALTPPCPRANPVNISSISV